MTERTFFTFKFGDYEARERELRVQRAGQVLAVEPKAFRVLIYLLHNPGRLIPKEELLSAVWGATAVQDNSLTRTVALEAFRDGLPVPAQPALPPLQAG